MTDLARLGFTVDSAQVDKGVTALNKLTPATEKAEVAVEGLNTAVKKTTGGLPGLTSNMQRVAGGAGSAASALAGVANASTMSTRAALAAGTSLGNAGRLADQAAAGHERLRIQTMAVTGTLQSEVLALQRVRDNLRAVAPAANEAGTSLDRLGKHASDNINKMQATPGNVAAQFSDIGVTAAGGMQPWLIALQQGTQLGAALSGGLGTLAAGFKSLLSPINLGAIALTFALALLIQWGVEAFKAGNATDKLKNALDDAQFSSSALGSAQSILGGIFDLTTGKMKDQTSAAVALAKAQAILGDVQSQVRANELRGKLVGISNTYGGSTNQALVGQGVKARNDLEALTGRGQLSLRTAQGNIANQLLGGKINYEQAIDGLNNLRKAGKLTDKQFADLAPTFANFGVELANVDKYKDTLKAINGDKGALEQFLNRPKPTKPPKGPKTDAEKLVDVWNSAQADIATQKARELAGAVGTNIERAAMLEQQTKLLNSIQQKNIPITDAVRQRVAALAAEYGRAKLAADTAEAFGKSILATVSEKQDLINQRELIGKYGEELIRLKHIQDWITKPQQRGIVFAPEEIAELTKRASTTAAGEMSNTRKQFTADMNKQFEEQIRLLGVQRNAIGLSDQALIAYNYTQQRITEALARGIPMAQIDIANIQRQGEEYAALKYNIDKMQEALDFTRETSKAFFTEWVQNVRQGQSVFEGFANAVLNALNKIIDKALDSALNGLFNASGIAGLFGGGGGTLSSANIAGAGSFDFSSISGIAMNAKGNAFNDNGIVDSPTLFKFAKGTGLMGEAGPEAIVPLKRGSDGSLGVQMHGGSARQAVNNNITNAPTYNVGGVMTPEAIIAAIRQGDEQSRQEIAAALPALLSEYQRNGTTG